MPTAIYHDRDGHIVAVDMRVGDSLMEAAMDHGIRGIVAECGGGCTCGTCHVYVDEAWWTRVPAADEMEQQLLDVITERRPNSRLSCQVRMSDALDGIEVHVANNETQGSR